MTQQIISFLNKHTITRIDSQTLIITQHQHRPPSSSLQFSYMQSETKHKNSKTHNITNISTRTPTCFLVKDLIIPTCASSNNGNQPNKQSEGLLANIKETLSHHQQLNNKYILTLLHYQMYVTSTPISTDNNIQTSRYHTLPVHKPFCSSHTAEDYNTRALAEQGHTQQNVRNTVDHLNYGENTNNCNSLCQDHDEEDSAAMSQSQNKFSWVLNNPNPNIIVNVNVQSSGSMQGNPKKHPPNILSSTGNECSQGPHNALRAIYQYGALTLKQQISNRIASSTQFEEQQLWAILATIVQALSYLQQQQIAYGVLGTDKIFINNSLVKILDPSATAADPLLISQGRLYSPEILSEHDNIDIFKSDIYIIGLIMLECGLLVDLSKEAEPNLNKYKDVFRDEYSKELLEVIEKCLLREPNARPTFHQLKDEIGGQLSWTDFSNNYDNAGARVLQPMGSDWEDYNNPTAQEIELEFESCNYDVLDDNTSKTQAHKRKQAYLTEYQRAKIKYLPADIKSSKTKSSRSGEPDQHWEGDSLPSQRHNNRYNNSIPSIELQKNHHNVKDTSISSFSSERQHNNNKTTVPHLNMDISESVYTDPPMATIKPMPANKTLQIHEDPRAILKTNPKREEHGSSSHNLTLPASNSAQGRINKTKLIKEKLVKTHNQKPTHISEPLNKHIPLTKNGQPPTLTNCLSTKQNNRQLKDNKYGESIEQQLYEQSESSYLYCNTFNTQITQPHNTTKPINKNHKDHHKCANNNNNNNKSNPITESCSLHRDQLQNGQNFLRNSSAAMMRNNGAARNSINFQTQNYQQKYRSVRPLNQMNGNNSENIITDPNLLKTIKDDLRIPAVKNMKNIQNYKGKENRYIK